MKQQVDALTYKLAAAQDGSAADQAYAHDLHKRLTAIQAEFIASQNDHRAQKAELEKRIQDLAVHVRALEADLQLAKSLAGSMRSPGGRQNGGR